MREEFLLRLSEVVVNEVKIFIFFLEFNQWMNPPFEAHLILQLLFPLLSHRPLVETHGIPKLLIYPLP